MKKSLILLAVFLAASFSAKAEIPPELVKAEAMAKVAAVKVLAIPDNEKAAQTLTAEIRAMVKDEKNEAVKAGAPELTMATIVKTDLQRAMVILPATFVALTEDISMELFQRLVASTLMAAGDAAARMTDAILAALAGKTRWIEMVAIVAKDTPRPLPGALSTAIQAISAATLPPAVQPPAPYEGQ